jgi:2-polyprenyl-3-methyl-5-hydroxy-6-metoxy-1,4-benzoquinol methylase
MNEDDANTKTPEALTSAAYWDNFWKKRPPIQLLSPRHVMLGRKGYFLRVARRRLGCLAGRTMAEIGGGGGASRLLALAKWDGVIPTAIDYSPVGLEQTRRTFKANGYEVETIHADALTWDPAGRQFDVVVHWGVLEHFTDPEPLLRASAAILKRGGLCMFSMPNMASITAHLWRKWASISWAHHKYHSDKALRASCTSVGLDLRKPYYYGVPALSYNWDRPGQLARLSQLSQGALNRLWWVMPVYHHTPRWLASERGFLAARH